MNISLVWTFLYRVLSSSSWVSLFFFSAFALAQTPEAYNEYVNDFADILSPSFERSLAADLEDVEYYSGVEMVVVTVDSHRDYGSFVSWEEFATRLFNNWRIGNVEKNNGVLLMISNGDRLIRIELGAGYPSHYDSIMKSIIDNDVAPLLTKGQTELGIRMGVDAIVDATTIEVTWFQWHKWYLFGGLLALISLIVAVFVDREKHPQLYWALLAFAGLLILAIIRSLLKGKRSEGFGGGSSSGGGASGSF